jgi:hypothetical protein
MEPAPLPSPHRLDEDERYVPPDGDTVLTDEERKSFTHGEFEISPERREVFAEALRLLNAAGVPYVVSGLYALHHYTGVYRRTKDLDLLLEPQQAVEAARVLREHGFATRLESPHWLGKAYKDGTMVDLVFGMANGLHLIDRAWYRHSRPALLADTPVRVAPPEELILHRLFISERHRSDATDVAHLLMIRGSALDWDRLLERVGDYWRLLLAQVLFFDFCYPGRTGEVPRRIREGLLRRAAEEIDEQAPDACICQGTLLSRFSFAIDVNEWGFRDYREEAIAAARSLPIVREIAASDAWDSVNGDARPGVPDRDAGCGRDGADDAACDDYGADDAEVEAPPARAAQ